MFPLYPAPPQSSILPNINHHPSFQCNPVSLSAIVNPCRYPVASGVQDCSMPRTATTDRWNIFCILFRRTHFPFMHFPFIPLTVLGSAASSLSLFVTFGLTLFRNGFVLVFPFSLCFFTPSHLTCLQSVFSQVGIVFTHRHSRT